jgi:hypothetical protein
VIPRPYLSLASVGHVGQAIVHVAGPVQQAAQLSFRSRLPVPRATFRLTAAPLPEETQNLRTELVRNRQEIEAFMELENNPTPQHDTLGRRRSGMVFSLLGHGT